MVPHGSPLSKLYTCASITMASWVICHHPSSLVLGLNYVLPNIYFPGISTGQIWGVRAEMTAVQTSLNTIGNEIWRKLNPPSIEI